MPPHLELVQRVLDETLPDLETPDPTDPREQMAPDQVQVCKLCSRNLLWTLEVHWKDCFRGQGLAGLCNQNNFKWLDALCFN